MEEKDNRKEKALMFIGSNIPQDKFHLKLAKWIFFRRSLHESIRENWKRRRDCEYYKDRINMYM